ncbi:hypothetical protein C8J56DRAFT_1061813 [Mycena floridula]|nr:hypothetical protein C8J56DRAFT_1061813 [Mycena floridula]
MRITRSFSPRTSFDLAYCSSSGMGREKRARSCSSGDKEPGRRVYRPPLGFVRTQPILVESEDPWDEFEVQVASSSDYPVSQLLLDNFAIDIEDKKYQAIMISYPHPTIGFAHIQRLLVTNRIQKVEQVIFYYSTVVSDLINRSTEAL